MLLIKPIDQNGSQLDSLYEVFFDWTGNIYLKSQKTNKTYHLLVDNKNNIELIYFDNPEFNECTISFKKMKLSSDPSSLKGKIVKTKINEENHVESDDETDNKLNKELYPENLEYFDDENENEEYSDDVQDYFEFSKTDNELNIYSSEEPTAIYETFIYNGSSNLHHTLITKTFYKGYSLPYRLLIFSSGEFIIKTIGISQWYNQLSELNNEPVFINSKNTPIKINY